MNEQLRRLCRNQHIAERTLLTTLQMQQKAMLSLTFSEYRSASKKIGTSKSNISRLESLNNTYMPNLATLIKYAEALEMRLDIGLK